MSSTGQPGTHTVRIGSLTVGDGPAVVVGGATAPTTDAAYVDVRWLSLRDDRQAPADRRHRHEAAPAAGSAAGSVAGARDGWDGPLLVEPGSPVDLPEIAAHADGVVLGAAWTGDLALVRAAAGLGLPVVLRRDPETSLDDWLDLAGRCAAEGGAAVVLCEGGRTRPADLALLRAARERSGRPVLAAPGEDAGLAGAAVAAGADGLWLAPEAPAETVAAAREAVTLIGALVRREAPATLAEARGAIDRVDAALAVLLERRAGLAGTVQRLKPVGGFAGRDMERERQLVAAMARRAPLLGEARLAPIMNAVIESGLHLAEELRGDSREPADESRRRDQALAGRHPDHD
ncbi:chorismate mutase [Sphaerisporangium sp. NPDC049003]|uniref:chorismate mutase n=1 Tax=Sphaerisporangium sp. NPDC049003 TaxID=3364517 RepID=UPI00370FF53F